MLALLFFVIVTSILVMFICILLLPTAISKKKKSEGHSGTDMFSIPEMYKKEWYGDSKLWIRTALIYSQLTLLICFTILYVLVVLPN